MGTFKNQCFKGQRFKNHRWGRQVEIFTFLWFWFQGYRILKWRYKTFVGEIDLILKRGKTLVFVEVKGRRSREHLFECLRDYQKRRIQKAAQVYLAQHPYQSFSTLRFDVFFVTPFLWPTHLKNV